MDQSAYRPGVRAADGGAHPTSSLPPPASGLYILRMDAASLLPDRPSSPPVLTVSALTLLIKEVVEGSFPLVWVSGEISNFSRPQSGHCYLTLKDDQAQIRAVVWRGTAAGIRCDLHDGLEVICRGHLDLYAPRGSYQLVIEEIQPKGLGALEQALRRLREKLAAEGLFDRGRKRPLPTFPRRIAVVTSPTGAAIRDFLQVLSRRWRGCDVLIVPVRVQGVGSADEIARAIATVNRLLTPVDVLVRRPRRREFGRPVGVQRRARGAGDCCVADSGRVGRGA